MNKGDIVNGHFCSSCLPSVDFAKASASNPYKTAVCISCGHRSEGLDSTGIVGDWLIIGKSEPAQVMRDLDPKVADCVQKNFSELIGTEPAREGLE